MIDTKEKLNQTFLEDIYSIPDGEKLKACIQCGTCSASCPTSYSMDYTPRQIISAFRAGMLDQVLRSNTIWMCASCYYCTVRCPSGIKLTDIMYELKRLGIKYKIYPPKNPSPVMAKIFVDTINQFGRSAETVLLTLFFLKTKPFKILDFVPLGWKLFTKGRIATSNKSIKGKNDLVKIIEYIEKKGVA
ncbi:MAG: 4Fe-4S dicluster domain-containing protein [candidate division Zixibacteria bacterium]|nr:4Fe-4S dicluster domain-containing protein [candidate division Zixibacteria bacterium]